MKFLKTIIFLFSLAILSCGSDDDGNPVVIPTPENITPNSTIDVEAIVALPPFSDITNLVTFGDDPTVSAADYVSEVELFDTLIFDTPQGLAPGDEFFYAFIEFFDELDEPIDEDPPYFIGSYLEAVLPAGVTDMTRDEYYEQDFWPSVALNVINAEDFVDVNWKYGFECYIRRGGTDFGPYYVDPKLRIKRKTSFN